MINDLKNVIPQIEGELLETFDYLHHHPEVSWKEVNTTKYLQKKLQDLGFQTHTFDDCTGVVGEWKGSDSSAPTVALRADMDALWQEVDGVWCANHSCGHDAHMTIVLGAAMLLKKSGFSPPGTLKIIFQPAEEKGTGALKMVEKGVVDDVDYLYGVHLRPVEELPLGKAAPAIYNGASIFIDGEIFGVSAHGARPHLGINAIETAFLLLNSLQTLHINPMIPSSIKMTRINAGGESANIIPGYAEFSLDIRAQTNDALNELFEKTKEKVRATAELTGARIILNPGPKTAASVVHEDTRHRLAKAIEQTLGEANLASDVYTPGGEDFHFYTLKRPHIKATMLALGCDLKPGLHHPRMTFNRDALIHGSEILARAVQLTF
ncbi:MAG: M20 peptidase aminoacylase family protein [Bacillaceae bacterium]|nr:M20 peptidase aminoacylase family protein [Bacillaceae bacterium]